jgi:hypothetical protein
LIDNVTVHAVGGLTLKTVLANEKITRGNQIMKMMMTNSNPPTPYKTTSTIGLWNIFHRKLMITSIAEFSHSNRTTAFSHDQVDGIFPVLKITLP